MIDDYTATSNQRQGPPFMTRRRLGELFIYAVIAAVGIVLLTIAVSAR